MSESNNNKRKFEGDQPKLKLYYFNIKGKGEPIRLFCAYTGLELDDYRFQSRDEFAQLKENGKLAFGQVPLLEIDDGKHQLVQTNSILRYLAKLTKVGYYSEDLIMSAKIDAILDQETDAFVGTTVTNYTTRFGIAMDSDTQKKCFDAQSNEILPRHFGNIEKLLEKSQSGWICNTTDPTIADFAWYARLGHGVPESTNLNEEIKSLKNFPSSKKFVEKFNSLDAIKEYYEKK